MLNARAQGRLDLQTGRGGFVGRATSVLFRAKAQGLGSCLPDPSGGCLDGGRPRKGSTEQGRPPRAAKSGVCDTAGSAKRTGLTGLTGCAWARVPLFCWLCVEGGLYCASRRIHLPMQTGPPCQAVYGLWSRRQGVDGKRGRCDVCWYGMSRCSGVLQYAIGT